MSGDEEAFARLRHDLKQQPQYHAVIQIVRNHDGTTGMSFPMGDKALCLEMLQQAVDVVNRNARDAGWQKLIPASDASLTAKPGGYT